MLTKYVYIPFLILFAMMSGYLYLVSSSYGVGISPDSMIYLSAAHHIADGRGMMAYWPMFAEQSSPLVEWPPLYCLFLSVFVIAKIDPSMAGWFANIICFGLNALLIMHLVMRCTQNKFVSFIAVSAFFF